MAVNTLQARRSVNFARARYFNQFERESLDLYTAFKQLASKLRADCKVQCAPYFTPEIMHHTLIVVKVQTVVKAFTVHES